MARNRGATELPPCAANGCAGEAALLLSPPSWESPGAAGLSGSCLADVASSAVHPGDDGPLLSECWAASVNAEPSFLGRLSKAPTLGPTGTSGMCACGVVRDNAARSVVFSWRRLAFSRFTSCSRPTFSSSS